MSMWFWKRGINLLPGKIIQKSQWGIFLIGDRCGMPQPVVVGSMPGQKVLDVERKQVEQAMKNKSVSGSPPREHSPSFPAFTFLSWVPAPVLEMTEESRTEIWNKHCLPQFLLIIMLYHYIRKPNALVHTWPNFFITMLLIQSSVTNRFEDVVNAIFKVIISLYPG